MTDFDLSAGPSETVVDEYVVVRPHGEPFVLTEDHGFHVARSVHEGRSVLLDGDRLYRRTATTKTTGWTEISDD